MSQIEKFGNFDGFEMGVFNGGVPFLTGSGLAAACGVKPPTITGWGESVSDDSPRWRKMSMLLQARGYTRERIFEILEDAPRKPNAYPEDVCLAFIEYYGYVAPEDDRTEQARSLFRQFSAKTFRDFVYALTGYKQPQLTFSQYTLSRITHHHNVGSNPLPDGYFCLFDKMIEILQKFDLRISYSLGEQWYDVSHDQVRFLEPDISLGRHFSMLFQDKFDEIDSEYNAEYAARLGNPKIKKLWSQNLLRLKWRRDKAYAEKEIRDKYKILLEYLESSDSELGEKQVDRKRYNFKPAPESNRPEQLDAYCYSNQYTSMFYDWLRDVFFKYVWRDYIVERDEDSWMQRYNLFQSLPDNQKRAILQTTEGNLIKGFDYYDVWQKQLPSG